MDKITRSIHIASTRDLLQIERHTQTESKGINKTYFIHIEMKKKDGVAIFIPDNTAFKRVATVRDNEEPSNSTSG